MTDREVADIKLAETWVGENGFSSDCNNINSVKANGEMVNAYLAGLKAGKPQWHDLRILPSELPKKDERFCANISVAVLTQSCEFAFYSFDDKKWYSLGKVIDVIAWCEIPKFEENE